MKRASSSSGDAHPPAAKRHQRWAPRSSGSSDGRHSLACHGTTWAPRHQALAESHIPRLLDLHLHQVHAALQLTTSAVSVATEVCMFGASDAADRALHLAESALAATMQQLGRAQALVVTKLACQQGQHPGPGAAMQALLAQQQGAPVGDAGEDLQDTCSSAYSTALLAC